MMHRKLSHLRHPRHTKESRLERVSPLVGAWLALTTWELWKHFWAIPIPEVNLYVGASLLTLGGLFIFYTVVGGLQDTFCKKRYIFNFPPNFNSFILGYTALFAALDFAFALTMGGSIW
jgi:prepilin signal peptidase PulO-like enzyme (type II secretory pathway)